MLKTGLASIVAAAVVFGAAACGGSEPSPTFNATERAAIHGLDNPLVTTLVHASYTPTTRKQELRGNRSKTGGTVSWVMCAVESPESCAQRLGSPSEPVITTGYEYSARTKSYSILPLRTISAQLDSGHIVTCQVPTGFMLTSATIRALDKVFAAFPQHGNAPSSGDREVDLGVDNPQGLDGLKPKTWRCDAMWPTISPASPSTK